MKNHPKPGPRLSLRRRKKVVSSPWFVKLFDNMEFHSSVIQTIVHKQPQNSSDAEEGSNNGEAAGNDGGENRPTNKKVS
jgi:hypothetical protein